MTRDPRTDPQPGDEVRVDGKIRRVIERHGDMLRCETFGIRHKIRLERWREWCEKSGTQTAKKA